MINKNRMFYIRKLAAKFNLTQDAAAVWMDDATRMLEESEQDNAPQYAFELAENELLADQKFSAKKSKK